jgi:dCMP deaminase
MDLLLKKILTQTSAGSIRITDIPVSANGRDLRGSKLYVALFPCNECAKAIIQSGVREVVYLSDKYADTPATLASKRMFAAAGVKCTQLRTKMQTLTLDFTPEEEK